LILGNDVTAAAVNGHGQKMPALLEVINAHIAQCADSWNIRL
jgi:hypothetical protein